VSGATGSDAGAAAVLAGGTEPTITSIEQRGIEHVPGSSRWGGPRAGTTAFAISRASFGPNGNRMPSFFNWVTQVGFEIEGIALVVLAAIALAAKAGRSTVQAEAGQST
jgi:hypothetical protein